MSSLVDTAVIEDMIRNNTGIPGRPAFRVLDVADHAAEISLPYDASMTRLGDTISGPVLMAMADAAMYAVIIAHVAHGQYAVTSHLNIEFLRRPAAGDLHARARILKLGRRFVPCQVDLFSSDRETLVAHVSGAYALMRPPATTAQ